MTKLHFVFPVTAALIGFAVPACGDKDNDDQGAEGGETESSTDTTPSTDTMTATDTMQTGSAGTDGQTSGTTSPPEPQPDGGMCSSDDGCVSGKCFLVPVLGGICGECKDDSDCPDGGCTIPNPLASPAVGSKCNMGENGGGCMSDDVCDSGKCALILNVSGILVVSSCSECKVDQDCTDGQLCSPQINVAEFSGQKVCVDPKTVPDGDACDLEGSGDEACEGYCEPADVMGLTEIGVCGPCDVMTGDGCMMGEECSEPTVDLGTGMLNPAMCSAGGTAGSTGG